MTEHLSTTAIITKTYNDNTVLTFRNDGWFNMTKAAKAFGKTLENFMRSPSTLEYIEALSVNFTGKELVEIKRGNGQLPQVGTWAHPELAVFFARWLDTKFAVWCDAVIDDILRGKAEVVITKPETSEIMRMPTTILEAGKLWLAQFFNAGKIPVLEIIPGNRYPLSFDLLAQQHTACHCSILDGVETS